MGKMIDVWMNDRKYTVRFDGNDEPVAFTIHYHGRYGTAIERRVWSKLSHGGEFPPKMKEVLALIK